MATKELVEKLITARVGLIFEHPFFGNIALHLRLTDASTWCPTAAVDGKRLYFNSDFINSLNPNELKFLIAHEVLHCCFDHFGRRGNRIPIYWNVANDYIVNYTLVKQKIGVMPKSGLYDEKYTDELTSEEVYDLLIKKYPPDGSGKIGKGSGKNKGSGKGLTTLDQHLALGNDTTDENGNKVVNRTEGWKDPNGNPDPGQETGVDYSYEPPTMSDEALADIKHELVAVMIGAVQSNQGNAPAGILRLIDQSVYPTLNWREILRERIQSYVKEDYTFSRYNKKSWSSGCILPGNSFGNRLNLAVSIDTSGSISDEMVAQFIGEVKAIMECFNSYEIHVWAIDAKVWEETYMVYTPENIEEMDDWRPKGGGGNAFGENWKFMRKIGLKPDIFLVLSDGYPCGIWGDPDYCETIFGIKNSWDKSIQAPFGQTVYLDD